jgi:hypothetical protein
MTRIDIKNAIEAAKRYCVSKKYNVDKIYELYKQPVLDKLYIVTFPGIKPNGLMNDYETRAIPVLVVNGDYTVTEWDGADKILK